MAGTLSLLPVAHLPAGSVPQQVALFFGGDDGGPGLTALLLVDQGLVVGQLGLWLGVNQGGVVSQVLYTLQLLLLHLMLKIQRVC